MTDNEIDHRLAQAIGYSKDRIRGIGGRVQVFNGIKANDGPMSFKGWQRFDHKKPAVIWPIAEQFDAFPMRFADGTWYTSIPTCDAPQDPQTSPATATAMAVIRFVEAKK